MSHLQYVNSVTDRSRLHISYSPVEEYGPGIELEDLSDHSNRRHSLGLYTIQHKRAIYFRLSEILCSAVRSTKGRVMKIQGSDGISEPAPHITFLPACFNNTTVSPVKDVG